MAQKKEKISQGGTLRYLGKSLYSNKECLDGHTRPWYWAFMFLILALALVWIPPFYHFTIAKGSGTLASTNGLDNALYQLATRDEYGFNSSYINDNNEFVASEAFKHYEMTETNKTGLAIKAKTSDTEQTIINVFYFDGNTLTDAAAKTKYSELLSKLMVVTDKDNNETLKPFSYLIFTKSNIYLNLFPLGENDAKTVSLANYTGRYDEFPKGAENTFKSILVPADNAKDITAVRDNWNNYLDLGFRPYAYAQMVTYLMIDMLGTLGAAILAGLIIFVASRGKRSAYSNMSYWGATKVGTTMCFTPIILGWIVGFILGSQFGAIAMFTLCAVRVTFSFNKMRIIAEEKPLYQART